ncbi:MAG: thioredoxin domain-containing protein [Deltaproteobacteria bacterium]|nr:thioredoxin domain-containing protein [Deltaproteobacteria bacterium]
MYRVASPDDLVGAEGDPSWTNRLVHETSPYLLQHAHNPVDWYPWTPEAFEKARREDRPILLSIGYAACHWCHVMEHESFSDPEVAAFLNTHFVPIKVDREERPDVDAIYIEALFALQGNAGWPANLFLFPDLRPFAGITYLPPVSRHGMPSFRQVLDQVRTAWDEQRAPLGSRGDSLKGIIGRTLPPNQEGIDRAGYERTITALVGSHDPRHGGQGQGQKFPQTPSLELLLLAAHDGMPGAPGALVRALRAMARGGLYDHLGGGFHRYCVDRAWTVPHFEKMLYDNAQLLRLYARASSLLEGRDQAFAEECAQVVRETVHYLDHDLSDESGAFWSSEDADDPGGASSPGHRRASALRDHHRGQLRARTHRALRVGRQATGGCPPAPPPAPKPSTAPVGGPQTGRGLERHGSGRPGGGRPPVGLRSMGRSGRHLRRSPARRPTRRRVPATAGRKRCAGYPGRPRVPGRRSARPVPGPSP